MKDEDEEYNDNTYDDANQRLFDQPLNAIKLYRPRKKSTRLKRLYARNSSRGPDVSKFKFSQDEMSA